MNPVKINRLQQIVRLRSMLKKWQAVASSRRGKLSFRSMSFGGGAGAGAEQVEEGAGRRCKPKVVPGHVAVYVGEERRRFWVKTAQLNHPVFRALLRKTEEEFGFDQRGALAIPCDPAFFQHLLWVVEYSDPAYSPADDLLLRDLLHFYLDDPALPPPRPSHADPRFAYLATAAC